MYEDIYVHIHPHWEPFHPQRIHGTIYSSAVGTVPSADYSTVCGHSKILHYYVVIYHISSKTSILTSSKTVFSRIWVTKPDMYPNQFTKVLYNPGSQWMEEKIKIHQQSCLRAPRTLDPTAPSATPPKDLEFSVVQQARTGPSRWGQKKGGEVPQGAVVIDRTEAGGMLAPG